MPSLSILTIENRKIAETLANKFTSTVKIPELITIEEANILGLEGVVGILPNGNVFNGVKFKFRDKFDDLKVTAIDFIRTTKGKIGGVKKDGLEVSFLTAIDESIFMQHNLHKVHDLFLMLLKNKIIDKSIDVKTLHYGDINAILLFLRYNAFGKDYDIICKVDNELRKSTIDITKIKIKNLRATN
jgi:hypothetical protein